MSGARVIVEVVAGLIPNDPMPEYTRRWALTGEEWSAAIADGTAEEKLAELNGRAQGYAMLLMLQPNRLNWVRTDWLWV